MPTPFHSRQAAPTSWSGAANTKPTTHNSEWRCTRCDKLLGVCRDGRMHLGPVAVWCRFFDHVMCSKGDEPWALAGQMNFARMRCGLR